MSNTQVKMKSGGGGGRRVAVGLVIRRLVSNTRTVSVEYKELVADGKK